MPTHPLTVREYAYLAITGSGTHEAVTETLGLRPSDAWNVGDTHPRNGRPRRHMRWELSSGLDDTHPLTQHIEHLLWHLKAKAEALRQLWLDYDLTLVCVGYFPQTGHGLHFDREQIRQAAMLGLAFDLDFYYVDDNANNA